MLPNYLTGEVKMSKQEELKKLNAEKKALNDKQKALREELNKGKDERTAARKDQAAVRKEIRSQKSDLRELSASIMDCIKAKDSEKLMKLADEIMETSAELAGNIRKFGETVKSLDEL